MPRKSELLLVAVFAALLGYMLLRGAGGDLNEWLLLGAVSTIIASRCRGPQFSASGGSGRCLC